MGEPMPSRSRTSLTVASSSSLRPRKSTALEISAGAFSATVDLDSVHKLGRQLCDEALQIGQPRGLIVTDGLQGVD